MIKNHLCLLVTECVRTKNVIVVIYPQLVLVMMGVQMTVDDTHGDSVHLPPDADTPLVAPVAAEADPRVLGLQTSDVGHVLAQAVETQDDALETDGADLHVTQR